MNSNKSFNYYDVKHCIFFACINRLSVYWTQFYFFNQKFIMQKVIFLHLTFFFQIVESVGAFTILYMKAAI